MGSAGREGGEVEDEVENISGATGGSWEVDSEPESGKVAMVG